MFLSFLHILAADAPPVSPRLDFPGSEWLIKVLGVILGGIALMFIALFFGGLVKTVRGIGSHHEGGAGGGTMLMIASIIGLAIVFGGTAFLNRWLNFFG